MNVTDSNGQPVANQDVEFAYEVEEDIRIVTTAANGSAYLQFDTGHALDSSPTNFDYASHGVVAWIDSTDEIGVFEMTDTGLMQVENPSALFLAERRGDVSGAAVFAGIEGTRPVLVEIQALVAPSSLGTPRRAVIGWDSGRLAMVLAVLQSRCGINMAGRDVYLNVAGGLRIGEPAADLAVASALVSAALDQPLSADTVIFGEVGLSGEVRSVSQADLRLKEASKLGFEAAWMPPRRSNRPKKDTADSPKLRISEMRKLMDMVGLFDLSGSGAEAAQ